MQIECKLKREGGTRVPLGKTEYHFAPLADGAHVAVVENEAHQDVFLGITEGYRMYRGAETATAAPVEITLPERAAAPIEPEAPAPAIEQPAVKLGDETLYGSSVHPATFEINGKTYSLGDVVALAHQGSGLDVQEWNELDPETRHGLIDDVLDELAADTNGDGAVDSAEERAALAAQYEAKFGKKPGNMGVAKLREKLAE